MPASNGSTFEGTSLPAGWTSTPWTDGSTASVANGVLTAESVGVSSVAKFASGSTLEFDANFSSGVYENAGFGAHFTNSDLAVFSTQDGGFWIYTNGSRTSLPTSYLGSMHHYKIAWGAGAFTYSIDGIQVGIMAWTTTNPMDVGFLDQNPDGKKLVVDNATVTPYAGAFASRSLTPATLSPGARSVTRLLRRLAPKSPSTYTNGNVSTPDSSWSAWRTVARWAGKRNVAIYSVRLGAGLYRPAYIAGSFRRHYRTSDERVDLYTGFGKRHITGRLHARYLSGTTTGSVQDGEVMLKSTNGTSFAGLRCQPVGPRCRGAVQSAWATALSSKRARWSTRPQLLLLPARWSSTARFTGGGYQNAGFSNDLNSTATVGISTQTGGGLYLYAGGTRLPQRRQCKQIHEQLASIQNSLECG